MRKTVQGEELKKGIGALFDMELNNYLMARAISQLDVKIASLGRKKNFAKPIRKTVSKCYSDAFIGGGLLGGIGCGIVIFLFRLFSGNLFSDLIESFLSLAIAIIVGGVVGGVVGMIVHAQKTADASERAAADYQKRLDALEKEKQKDEARVKLELEYARFLRSQQSLLNDKYCDSQYALGKLYNAVGIDYKYRNLIAIGYMDEFIRLKIATRLEGTDGLYYLIMQKLTLEQMNCTLQEISLKLDVIIDKQNQVYAAIVAINEKCDGLLRRTQQTLATAVQAGKTLDEIADATDIAAYHAERCAREAAYRTLFYL